MSRIVFNGTARLVGKLAEIDFESVRRSAEHVDIRARAKDARLQTRHDHGPHCRMFKAQPLNRVSQFNIHAEVIRIEFQFVAVSQRRIFLHVHREPGDSAVYRQLPVFVLFRRSLKVNHAESVSPARAARAILCRSNVRSINIVFAWRRPVKLRHSCPLPLRPRTWLLMRGWFP